MSDPNNNPGVAFPPLQAPPFPREEGKGGALPEKELFPESPGACGCWLWNLGVERVSEGRFGMELSSLEASRRESGFVLG